MQTLKNNGVRVHLIAQIIQADYGVAKSTTYYHIADNKEAYDNKARQIRSLQKEKIKQKIRQLIDQDLTTGDIARQWNVDLSLLNKIYCS